MLQDLTHGRLENEYRPAQPREDDLVLWFREADVLLERREDGTLNLPTVAALPGAILRYAFRIHGRNYYLKTSPQGDAPVPFGWERVRTLRQIRSKEVCYGIMTGWHLYQWYQKNRFCGGCGAETVHDEHQRMLRCPVCGNLIFPRINPVVITAVTDGEDLLLSKYAGRGYTNYALIAGYTEIGETMEQAVRREVMEEVGLEVTNIRYYKSQPWGIDGNILMGFFCDLQGSRRIRLDREELSMADWYPRKNLPIEDDGYSLTREMIRIFGEGKEPK